MPFKKKKINHLLKKAKHTRWDKHLKSTSVITGGAGKALVAAGTLSGQPEIAAVGGGLIGVSEGTKEGSKLLKKRKKKRKH